MAGPSEAQDRVFEKLTSLSWNATLGKAPYVVACVPGVYTVSLYYDPLIVTASMPKAEHAWFDVVTGLKQDGEFVKSYFNFPDDAWPSPAALGPWVLRVRYDESFMRRGFCLFRMDIHDGGFDLRNTIADDDGQRFLVIFSDDNAEELFAQIRFTPAQEKVLDDLLRDMHSTGRMASVDALLRRSGVTL
jgi:hypothetical protein